MVKQVNGRAVKLKLSHILGIQMALDGCFHSTESFFNWIEERRVWWLFFFAIFGEGDGLVLPLINFASSPLAVFGSFDSVSRE